MPRWGGAWQGRRPPNGRLAESILLIGAFVPTLTLLLIAGASAGIGHISLPLVIAAAAGAVIAGDFVGHRTGRLLGERLRTGRVGCGIPGPVWQRAEILMNRHGRRAVLFARFVPVVRTLTPHFAGAASVPQNRALQCRGRRSWATIEAVVATPPQGHFNGSSLSDGQHSPRSVCSRQLDARACG